MKKYFLILSMLVTASIYAQNQTNNLSQENIKPVVQKFIAFFNEYDNANVNSVKKVKFNKIVDDLNPNLSPPDREKAYQIVDAYIMADNNEKITENNKEKLNHVMGLIKDFDTQKQEGIEYGMNAVKEQVNIVKNMSYTEYESYISQMTQGVVNKSEIKKSYNQLHKNDGKQVAIIETDKNPTKIQNQLQAIEILRNPKKYSYQEFEAAAKMIKPTVTDKEIKKLGKPIVSILI